MGSRRAGVAVAGGGFPGGRVWRTRQLIGLTRRKRRAAEPQGSLRRRQAGRVRCCSASCAAPLRTRLQRRSIRVIGGHLCSFAFICLHLRYIFLPCGRPGRSLPNHGRRDSASKRRELLQRCPVRPQLGATVTPGLPERFVKSTMRPRCPTPPAAVTRLAPRQQRQADLHGALEPPPRMLLRTGLSALPVAG